MGFADSLASTIGRHGIPSGHVGGGFFNRALPGIVHGEWNFGNRIMPINRHTKQKVSDVVKTPFVARAHPGGVMDKLFGRHGVFHFGFGHGPARAPLANPTTSQVIINAHKKANYVSPMLKYGAIAVGGLLVYKLVK